MNDAYEGGCLCGAVRYRISAAPRWVAHCHCRSCRRQTGAAFATYAGVTVEQFSYRRGAPRRRASSPGAWRSFCSDCGTPLTYEGERWPGEVHVHVGSLDRPELLVPRAHVYVEEAMPWIKLTDGLPCFPHTAKDSKPLP